MPRNARRNSTANYFHIISQGLNREKIFDTPTLKLAYLENLVSARKPFPDIKLITYCVMSNHCHLLVYTPDISVISSYMRRVNTRFAQYYNFKTQRVGYVFRGRFTSQEISDERYLANCFVYINNNPVRAGLANFAEEYMFGGMKDYIAGNGNVVDFEKAAELFDISPDNIRAITAELTATDLNCPAWIESEEDAPSAEQLVSDAIAAAGISRSLLPHSPDELSRVCAYLLSAGLSRKTIADCLGIDRHRLKSICNDEL